MKLKSILEQINKKYPENLQYSWDNSGLNIGNLDSDVNKIMLTLEITSDTVDEAVKKGVDLIISHHPFMFSKVNQITNKDLKGKLIYKLIKNDINVYCMHTSSDVAENGLNDYFVKLMSYKPSEILDPVGVAEFYDAATKTTVTKEYGLGRIVRLGQGLRALDFLQNLKAALKIENIRLVGDPMNNIESFAVVTGSGAEYFEMCHQKNVDLLITGDMKYHQAIDSKEMGVMVADFGHFGTEDIFAESIIDFIRSICEGCEIFKSDIYINPFTNM